MITDNTKTIIKAPNGVEIDITPYKKAQEVFFSARTKKILAVFAVVFSLFAGIYKFIIPNFIKPEQVYALIQSSVNEGYSINIKNLKTDLGWDFTLVLDTDGIDLRDKKRSILTSEKSRVKLPLLSLLFRNTDNSQFYSTGAKVYLERDKSGIFNVRKIFKIKQTSAKNPKLRVAIRDYNIEFLDGGAKPIIFDGHNLDLGNLKLYRLKTFGTVAFADGEKTILNINFISKKPITRGEFFLKGDIENLDLKKIEPYIKEFLPEVTSAKGVLRGDFDIDAYGREKLTNNMKVSLNANNIFISTRKYSRFFEIADDAQIFAEGKYFHHRLNLKNARIVSRDYNLELKGKIIDIDKKVKNLDVVVKSKNSSARKVMGLVPKSVHIKHDAVNKCIKHNIDAIVSCNLKIKGKTKASNYWGNINIKKFVVDGDISQSRSRIDLSYKKRKITINGTLIDTKNGIVNAFGTSLLGDEPYVNYKVHSDKFYLPEFRKNILAMADILEFSSGILPDLQTNGFGRVDTTIIGSGKKAELDGFLQLFDSSLKHSKIAKPVQIRFANVDLYGRKLLFKNLEASIDGHKSVVNGFVSLDKVTDVTIVSNNFPLPLGLYILGNSSLFEKTHRGVAKVAASSGNINLKLRFTSDFLHPEIKPEASILLLGNGIKFTEFSPLVSNLRGAINLDGTKFTLPKPLTGSLLGTSIQLDGQVVDQKIDAIIKAPSVDFAQSVHAVLTSKASYKLVPLFSNFKNPSGKLNAVVSLKGDMSQDFFDKIDCNGLNLKFYLSKIAAPVLVKSGEFSSTKSQLTVKKIPFELLNSKGYLDGKVRNLDKKPDYDLKIDIFNIDKDAFDAIKKCNISPKVRMILNNTADFSGNAQAHIKIQKLINGKISFHNVGFRYVPASLPVRLKDGELLIKGKVIELPNSHVFIGNSKMKLSGLYSLNGQAKLDLSGNLTPEEIDKYLNRVLLHPLNLKQSAPVKLSLVKNNNSTKVIAGILLNPQNVISYKGISVGNDDNSYVLGGGYSTSSDLMSFDNLGIAQYPNQILAYLGFNNLLLPKNSLQISGWINKKSLDENLHFYSREFVSTNILNELLTRNNSAKFFNGGTFMGDISAKGRVDAPKLLGNLEFRLVKIPSVKMLVPSLKMIFTNDSIYFKEGILRIADFEFNFEGVAENVIEMPYVFKDVTLTTDFVNIDELVKVFAEQGNGTGALPFITVKNGTMAAKSMVFSDLNTEDAKASFSFTPDWVLTLDKFSFSSAGGEVIGDMAFNFANYESNARMKFKNLKANAVATTLIQMPNEIYGLLNGYASFSTRGISRSDMIKNSNGNIKFQVTSGRLVRMGSLEYLLMAVEVVKSGVTGLCLNNICTILAPCKSGDFDTINVDFKVKNGVLFTDDLVSRGQHLSIYLAGNFDMTTNYSDFTILGRVSKSATNLFGPIGDLSISKLLNALPGDSGNKGVLDSLSKFPGMDFNDKTYRRFVVNIEGDLYDPKSVKDFRWLD